MQQMTILKQSLNCPLHFFSRGLTGFFERASNHICGHKIIVHLLFITFIGRNGERIIVPLDRRPGNLKFTYPGQYRRRVRLPWLPG